MKNPPDQVHSVLYFSDCHKLVMKWEKFLYPPHRAYDRGVAQFSAAQIPRVSLQTGRLWRAFLGSSPIAASRGGCLQLLKPQWACVTMCSFSFAVSRQLVFISSIRPSALSQGQRAFCILDSCPSVPEKLNHSWAWRIGAKFF